MSGEQYAGQNHKMGTGDKFLENMAQFKYLGRTLANQNCIHEEIKSRLSKGNASYCSVQNNLSSSMPSKKFEE